MCQIQRGRRNHLTYVRRNEDHVQVGEAAELKKALTPFIPLLHLNISQHLIVDADESVQDLERVKHLVG